jgi:hypothetical protein
LLRVVFLEVGIECEIVISVSGGFQTTSRNVSGSAGLSGGW